jgi:hypothetical protein
MQGVTVERKCAEGDFSRGFSGADYDAPHIGRENAPGYSGGA